LERVTVAAEERQLQNNPTGIVLPAIHGLALSTVMGLASEQMLGLGI
jgi:hypothetical protein